MTTALDDLMGDLTPEQRAEVDGQKQRAQRANGARPGAAHSAWQQANDLDSAEVGEWLGLRDGHEWKCPNCESTSGFDPVRGGFKCLHQRCSDRGSEGFLTVVDMVAEIRKCEPWEAVNEIAARFGFEPLPEGRRERPAKEVAPAESPTIEQPLRGLKALAKVATLGRRCLRKLAAEPVDYLWQDYVVAATIVLLAGPPGEGKTTLLFLIAAVRLHAGEPVALLGRLLRPAPAGQWVIVIEAEQSEKSSARKLAQSFELLGLDDAGLDRLILIARKSVTIGSPAWEDITTLTRAGLVSDIILDTLSRVAPANSDSEQDQIGIFDAVTSAIEGAPEGKRPTVWCAAHTRKTRQGGLADVSGSAQRTGQADTVLMCDAEKIGGRVASVKVIAEKLREPPDDHPPPAVFAIINEDGHRLLRQDVGPSTDDTQPLEERILDQLRREPRTKNQLSSALGRSYQAVDDALTNLFTARAIRTTEKTSARGRKYKAFAIAPCRESRAVTAESQPDFQPDLNPTDSMA